ncbi:MAG: hypothetical protein K0V04_34390 [Deltaproteobacteria bacterium]|nr:hypothetical protein [Deltaproteobacteria bacterium]
MSLSRTLGRLPPAATEYSRELMDEHWAEASWLYERRETLVDQQSLVDLDQWHRIETRADAHVEGLLAAGRLAIDDCPSRAIDGDAGELHTAIRLLARAEAFAPFAKLLTSIDWGTPGHAAAVRDALAWDGPDGWAQPVAALLEAEDTPPLAASALASAAGLRRWPIAGALVQRLERSNAGSATLLQALGRLQAAEALPLLYDRLREGEPAVRRVAARAALRFEPAEVGAYLAQVARTDAWATLPLAVCAGPEAWPVLEARLDDSPSSDGLLAVGILGATEGIEPLLDALSDETLASAAAESLYLLTGAPLYQRVVLVEPVDDGHADDGHADDGHDDDGHDDDADDGDDNDADDDDFADDDFADADDDDDADDDVDADAYDDFDEEQELERTAPRHAPAVTMAPNDDDDGLVATRLTRDRDRWSAWLRRNETAFHGPTIRRMRLGVPFEPSRVLDELALTTCSRRLRSWMIEELAIRHSLASEYSPLLPVVRQRAALHQARRQDAEAEPPVVGAWYLAGLPNVRPRPRPRGTGRS